MDTFNKICTCQNLSCPLHPSKHDKGCTPCIAKNLKLKEIPSCFFNLIPNAEKREGDTFQCFAKAVTEQAQ
ncbi:DUF6485 family protein [Anaerotignum propionicum]|uniref:DUF6485 family protein n=1 Tax=Anaerotignum propionicum TaxID=28446 RepID=UPI00210DC09E|nr:DUF6485 family protein [Anaerotignum propionicum]MCQ4935755.1 DUF6485 family protein [Anaerotignum propionicum]